MLSTILLLIYLLFRRLGDGKTRAPQSMLSSSKSEFVSGYLAVGPTGQNWTDLGGWKEEDKGEQLKTRGAMAATVCAGSASSSSFHHLFSPEPSPLRSLPFLPFSRFLGAAQRPRPPSSSSSSSSRISRNAGDRGSSSRRDAINGEVRQDPPPSLSLSFCLCLTVYLWLLI